MERNEIINFLKTKWVELINDKPNIPPYKLFQYFQLEYSEYFLKIAIMDMVKDFATVDSSYGDVVEFRRN